MDIEEVPAGLAQGGVALLDAPQPDRLDRVDAERLDDRLPALHPMSIGASAIIEALQMRAHPEGGWYAETWRARAAGGARPHGSAILYLLAAGERSHWHRFDADEVWQFSAGDPLELQVWADGDAAITVHHLGADVAAGSAVQAEIGRA